MVHAPRGALGAAMDHDSTSSKGVARRRAQDSVAGGPVWMLVTTSARRASLRAGRIMSPWSEALLTCRRELRRNLRSAKGVVMGLLFLLGGGAASLIYAAISELAMRVREGRPVPPEAFRGIREEFWSQVWDKDIGHYLADSPWIFVALFKAVWWFVPFITLMIGFEQVCGDLQHRSIRYDAIRARRGSLVVGKALAIWIVVSLLVLALDLFVWTVTVARGESSVLVALSWGGRFWALTTAYIAAYAGLTILVSSLTRRPVLSLFIGLVAFAALGLGDMLTSFFEKLEPGRYAFPGFYQVWLVTPRPAEMIAGVAVLLAFGAASTAAASWHLNRSDL
jgi:ABC-type transport system involved in multi-copper enzyme maturation permease subunit